VTDEGVDTYNSLRIIHTYIFKLTKAKKTTMLTDMPITMLQATVRVCLLIHFRVSFERWKILTGKILSRIQDPILHTRALYVPTHACTHRLPSRENAAELYTTYIYQFCRDVGLEPVREKKRFT